MKPLSTFGLTLPFFALLLLASCSEKSTVAKFDPPANDVKGAINGLLPAYVSVAGVQIDDAGPNQYKFKATATVQEPLYTLTIKQPELSGVPSVPDVHPPCNLNLLNLVTANGASITLYGHFSAEKVVDKWTYSDVTFESGLEQLGKPAGSFPPGTFISGRPEAEKALTAFTAAIVDYKQKTAAILEQEKSDADKVQKEKEAQIAVSRAKFLDAVKAGKTYEGTLAIAAGNFAIRPKGTSESVKIIFTRLTGFLVKADAINPNNPAEHQSFTGTINFDPSAEPDSYPLTMGPDRSQTNGTGWMFFWAAGHLNLRLIEGRLEGNAQIGDWGYSVSLQETDTQHDLLND